jgi:hypothetical protein
MGGRSEGAQSQNASDSLPNPAIGRHEAFSVQFADGDM